MYKKTGEERKDPWKQGIEQAEFPRNGRGHLVG